MARHAFFLIAAYMGYDLQAIAPAVSRNRVTGYNSITKALHFAQQDAAYRSKLRITINTLKNEKTNQKNPYGTSLYRCAIDAIL